MQIHTQGKTCGKGSHLQAKESGLRRNQPCHHLDLGLSLQSCEKNKSLFKLLSLWYFAMAAQVD